LEFFERRLIADDEDFDRYFRKLGIAEDESRADELMKAFQLLQHSPGSLLTRRGFYDVSVRTYLNPAEKKREGQRAEHARNSSTMVVNQTQRQIPGRLRNYRNSFEDAWQNFGNYATVPEFCSLRRNQFPTRFPSVS